ncbi:MAG: hypothetical protein ABSD20_10920 [Terriglobales bacterium]|jgi:predicted DNA-binding ribbon-helix-helix protein
MKVAKKSSPASVRRSVTLPAAVARKVDAIARRRRLSANRVLVELVEQGIEEQKNREQSFFDLAKRFRAAADPQHIEQLGDELGRFVFGE